MGAWLAKRGDSVATRVSYYCPTVSSMMMTLVERRSIVIFSYCTVRFVGQSDLLLLIRVDGYWLYTVVARRLRQV